MNTPLPFRPVARDARPLRLCIFGAAPATGNLGVTALCHALLHGIARREPDAQITVLDDRPGVRSATLATDGRPIAFRQCGALPTRRVYRRDSLWRMRADGRLGWRGAPALEAIRDADTVFDVTGGDSLTDLYGRRRLARGLQEKRLVIEQGRPLVLAPQTIGPFASARARRAAASVLRAASMIWCRDERSLVAVGDLLESAFDPLRHRLGVDLAFGLPARPPQEPPAEPLATWLRDGRAVVGLNVSGLVLNDEDRARRRFGLRADYRGVVTALLARLLDDTDCRVVLIPHVITTPGHPEHDPDAARQLYRALRPEQRSRVAVVDGIADPAEAKWLIAQCTWMCATRMHAAIAALSSGVPATALAYSVKAAGVFAACGQDAHVADMRHHDTHAVLERVWASFCNRDETRERLALRLPDILAQGESQLDAMALSCRHERRRHPDTTTPTLRAA